MYHPVVVAAQDAAADQQTGLHVLIQDLLKLSSPLFTTFCL
jgi:hypothetical protein